MTDTTELTHILTLAGPVPYNKWAEARGADYLSRCTEEDGIIYGPWREPTVVEEWVAEQNGTWGHNMKARDRWLRVSAPESDDLAQLDTDWQLTNDPEGL